MDLLTNKAGVAATLQVAIGYDALEFNTFIREAQDFDLKPLLPERFYFDMLKNRSQANYLKLIEGSEYIYQDATIYFYGIKKAIDYFTYSRFVLNSSSVSTSHGMVVKTTPNSTPLSLEERKNLHYKKISEAGKIVEDVLKFIERNLNEYPMYKNTNCEFYKGYNFSTKIIK